MGGCLLLFMNSFGSLPFLFVAVEIVEDGFVAARLGDLHAELP